MYTLPFYFSSFVTSQYSHSQLIQRDQISWSAGRIAVTDVLVSLVGKDAMYTAESTVISFSETVQPHKGQIRLLMMVKGH